MNNEFYQQGPELENTFESDPMLKKWIQKKFSSADRKRVETQLELCGKKAATTWRDWALMAESRDPVHRPFDPWGRRIDEIELSPGWKELENEAAREGIVATAFERKSGALSRAHQMSLLYLFHPSSAFVSCPLAMTDGAARCLELLGSTKEQKNAFQHLTSRDPARFWTSGQWMTEKTGGSDVSQTSTVAIPHGDEFKLYGTKWFTSATTSQMSLALAKVQGSDTLSLFFVELRNEEGRLKNIEILRLKNKLGTKALPTAEILLKGTSAQKVGDLGAGVKNIATMLNVTRSYNAICCVAHMRRALDLLKSYSNKRMAFGKLLMGQKLHQLWIQQMERRWQRCFAFAFRISELLGKEETTGLSADEKLELRLMTPLLKLFTAREVMQVTSHVCEGFGGAGYIEDVGVARLLRDAQVFSIWEGTTHILALDFWRAVKKEEGSVEWLKNTLHNASKNSDIKDEETTLDRKICESLLSSPVSEWEESLFQTLFSLSRVYCDLNLKREGFEVISIKV